VPTVLLYADRGIFIWVEIHQAQRRTSKIEAQSLDRAGFGFHTVLTHALDGERIRNLLLATSNVLIEPDILRTDPDGSVAWLL